MFKLTHKKVVITGGCSGIGKSIALTFLAQGAEVHVIDLKPAAEPLPSDINLHLADITNIESVKAIADKLGSIDILVNNTGGPPPTLAAGQDPALWQKSFNDMVLSLISITDRVLPGMRQRKWGRIITSTTSGAIAPIKNLAISNTLRAALLAWSKTLAAEVAAEGITVNVIMPGRVATDRLRQLDEARAQRENVSYDSVVQASLKQIPMGRYGDPQEYGDTAAFLASQSASFITGSVIRVDGGQIQAI